MSVLLLTRPGGILVSTVLDALQAQTRTPDRIVLTGLDPDSDEVAEARAHPLITGRQGGGVALVVRDVVPPGASGRAPLADVVHDAIDTSRATTSDATAGDSGGDSSGDADPDHTRGGAPERWWWFLTDDSRPDPDALSELLDLARRTRGAGIIGPKLLDRDDPRLLRSMGYRYTRAGRPAESIDGELDQGQYDGASDALGVPLAGLLIKDAVFVELGGLDPAFDEGAEGLDLSWRSHLAGHRVVLAPAARVELGREGLGVDHPWRARVRARQVALARGSWWWQPFRSVAVLVMSSLAAIGLVLVKRPRDAAGEVGDVVAVLSPWRGWGARWRFRGRARVPRRHLRGLFDTSRTAWRGTADLVQDALTPRAATGGEPRRSVSESGPVSEEFQGLDSGSSRRWWSWPLVGGLALTLAAAVVRWRDLWAGLSGSSAGVAGGELGVQTAGSLDLWQQWWGAWSGPGLGSAAPSEPWLGPVAGLTWVVERLPWVASSAGAGGLTVAMVLFAALPLAFLTAYVSGRVLTDRPGPRFAAGLLWAALPPLTGALGTGRLGPIVVHLFAPLIVAGFLVATGPRIGALRTAAASGTILAMTFSAWFVPGVLLVYSAAALVALAVAPGLARLRALAMLVLPWLLLGPWLGALLEDPRLLFGGAGATTTDPAVEPWQALLLHPGGPVSPALWWTAPLLLLALLGTLRSGVLGRRAGIVVVGSLLALAAALGAPHLVLGEIPEGYSAAGAEVTTWPGSYLSIAAAGLLLAALAAVQPLRAAFRWESWRRAGVSIVAGTAMVATIGLVIWSVGAGLGPLIRVADRPYPAVVTEQAAGPDATRVLVLRPGAEVVSYRLDGREPGGWITDVTRDISPVTAGPAVEPAQDDIAIAAALLIGAQQATVPGADPEVTDPSGSEPGGAPGVHARLHDLAVAYVQVYVEVDDPLAQQIDGVPGLTRLGGTTAVQMWRVAGVGEGGEQPPARARLVDADGDPVRGGTVAVTGSHARVQTIEVTGVPAGSSLLISASQEWSDHAIVEVDGQRLAPQVDGAHLRYPLPAGTDGAVSITVEVTSQAALWYLITAIALGVVAFLALPFGARRKERG